MCNRFKCIIILIIPLFTRAQTTNVNDAFPTFSLNKQKGIKWTTGLSWEQIKQKAKDESKYIFIDAYTTWCGPCKMMEKYVYPNDTLGDFFNEHYIAVKAQMDQTDNDDQIIKNWYEDAAEIKRDYVVNAFPSLIFLSSEGKIIQKEEGYRSVQKLVNIAKEALIPGKVYDDPYCEYKNLVNEYKKGLKRYDRMPYMIRTALKLNDVDLAKQLAKDHLSYASGQEASERYTKENIEMWTSFNIGINSKAFQFFYKDGDKIDVVMGKKNYSASIVDNSIQTSLVDSFFRMQKGETSIITGEKVPNNKIMFVRLPLRKDGKINPDFVEADWKKLERMIRRKFNSEYAKRNVLTARMKWYTQHQNMVAAVKIKLIQLDRYPLEVIDNEAANSINNIGWAAFLYVNDRDILKKTTEWMAKAVQQNPKDNILDTYAGLLYKMGRVSEAIRWEEQAIERTNSINEGKKKAYCGIIEKMKRNEPTYLEEGAIWKSIPKQND